MNSNPKHKIEAGYPRRWLVGGLMLVILVLVAFLTLRPFFPKHVTPTSAPADLFSAENALAHLNIIASEPHLQGSPAQARVRAYLVQELTQTGLEVEVQQTSGVENVVARLHGKAPDGAILILAHYDSSTFSPGAADNGSGVATLLEIMRALAAGPGLRNDVIALFDDGEELPDPYTGTKVFIREHSWMADVRVAIGMDTAVRGYICIDDTGSENGWMVNVLSHAYTGGVWSSISGGGNYDSKPFREAGIQVLELEDNYPFYEQHTPGDVPSIVKPGTLQQLGEQALSVRARVGRSRPGHHQRATGNLHEHAPAGIDPLPGKLVADHRDPGWCHDGGGFHPDQDTQDHLLARAGSGIPDNLPRLRSCRHRGKYPVESSARHVRLGDSTLV